MRRTRSTLGAALVAVMVLAGCQGQDAKSADGDCDSGDAMKVGTILPITGATADAGAAFTEGTKLAVDEINADGGVNGHCIEIIAKDEGNDPTKSAQAASELIDRDGVVAIIGPSGSGSVGAVAPIAKEAGVPFFHLAASRLSRSDAPLGFGMQITNDQIGPSFVEYAKKAGWSSLAVLAVNNTFGTSLLDSTTAAAKEAGIDVVGNEVHESGTVDLAPQVRTLRDKKPDALVVASFGADAVAALKARLAVGWDVPVIGPSGLSYEEVVNGAGPEGIKGVLSSMYPRQLAADPSTGKVSEAGEKLRAVLKKSTGEDPLTINVDSVAVAYDAVYALFTAFDGAGTDDAEKAADHLISEGYDGVRANYRWTDQDTAGFPLEANSIVVAASLKDGVLTLAE